MGDEYGLNALIEKIKEFPEVLAIILFGSFHRLPLHIQFEVLKHGKEVFCRNEKALLEIGRRALSEYLEMSDMYERIKRSVLACE